jgi:glycine/D-amino acid oxidase-like deaminating enzyme
VVVGAGVLGVTAAYRLAQAGAAVTVVDAGEAGRGATGASFAHVNASYSGYWDYVELRQAGIDGYQNLRREPGGASWWHDTGYLSVHRSGTSVAGLDEHVSRLQRLGYPVERVDVDPSGLDPALSVSEVGRTYHFPGEGYVDLPGMVQDLLSRARQLGADVRTKDPVTAVLSTGSAVTGVQLRSGDRLACDQLVVCCGRWTDDLLGLAGLETELVASEWALGTPVPGLLVVTEPVQGPVTTSVAKVVSVDAVNYRPEAGGRTLLWSAGVDRELLTLGGLLTDPAVTGRLAQDLFEAAAAHVPGLGSTRVQRAVVTMRALPVDGLPVVGHISEVDGLYVVLAHAGVTVAPALADAVVAEVVHGEHDERLTRFRPDRLLATAAPAPTAT